MIRAVSSEDLLAARPVYARAILKAFSLASAPPLVRKEDVEIARRERGEFRTQRARGSVAIAGVT